MAQPLTTLIYQTRAASASASQPFYGPIAF
jgi:hypothetical protein